MIIKNQPDMSILVSRLEKRTKGTMDKKVSVYLDKGIEIGGTITVDDALNTTSENPVQNKVIATKINELDTTIGDIETILHTLNEGEES